MARAKQLPPFDFEATVAKLVAELKQSWLLKQTKLKPLGVPASAQEAGATWPPTAAPWMQP